MFKILSLVVLFLTFLHPALARAEHPLATQYTTCAAYYHTLAGVYDTVNPYKALVLRRRLAVARKALTPLVGADTTAVARIEAALDRLAFAFDGSLVGAHQLEAAYDATCTDLLLPLTR